MHPKDRRTLLIVFGSLFGLVFAMVLLVTFVLPPGRQTWAAKVVVLDQTSVCVVARPGSNPPEGSAERCFSRGSDEVKPAWSELELGGCVGMVQRDEYTLEIEDTDRTVC